MSRQPAHMYSPKPLDDMNTSQDQLSHVSFTVGPARFLMTSDGTKDCLALLVSSTFVEQLADFYQNRSSISAMEGHLIHARMDASSIEASIQMTAQSLDTVGSQDEENQARECLEHQKSRLLRICKRRDELEEEDRRLRHEVEISRAHTEWVLETAMEAGNLLKPHRSFIPSVYDYEKASERSASSARVSISPARPAVDPVKLRHQEADEEVRERRYELERVQRLFNDKEREYEERLADWKRGEFDMSRSEFDRRMLVYNQQITGSLIDREASFENAKERAAQLSESSNVSGSPFHSHSHEGSMSPQEVAWHASSIDRSFINAWRADVTTSGCQEDLQVMHAEHVDNGLVQISDSTSAADDGEYTKMINRWQKARGVYEGVNRPRANDIWTGDVGAIDRRYSS